MDFFRTFFGLFSKHFVQFFSRWYLVVILVQVGHGRRVGPSSGASARGEESHEAAVKCDDVGCARTRDTVLHAGKIRVTRTPVESTGSSRVLFHGVRLWGFLPAEW